MSTRPALPRPPYQALARLALAGATMVSAWPVAGDPMRPLTPSSPGFASTLVDRPGGPVPPAGRQADPPISDAAPSVALRGTRRGHDGRWQALVGDRWVAAGDRLGEARVTAVDADRLQLAVAGTVRTLHLLPQLGPARKPWPSTADAAARPTSR